MRSNNWLGGHCLGAFIGDFTCCVRESEIDERVPSGDFLFHVPYRLRRNSNLNANFFLAKASCMRSASPYQFFLTNPSKIVLQHKGSVLMLFINKIVIVTPQTNIP